MGDDMKHNYYKDNGDGEEYSNEDGIIDHEQNNENNDKEVVYEGVKGEDYDNDEGEEESTPIIQG